jgi:hypothetical protein
MGSNSYRSFLDRWRKNCEKKAKYDNPENSVNPTQNVTRIFRRDEDEFGNHLIVIGEYVSLKLHMQLGGTRSSHDSYSKQILNLKNGDSHAVRTFLHTVRERICENSITICCVPSHSPKSVNCGMRKLTQNLAKYGNVDGSDCLVRTREITKLSTGGNRDIKVHLESIEVHQRRKIMGKTILILDDISTTGNSLKACARLVRESGAARYRCLVLGQTISKTF